MKFKFNNNHLDNIKSCNSAKFLLDNIRKEYEYENNRNTGLQNRAGIFISFIGVIFTLIPSFSKTPTLNCKDIKTIYQLSPIIVYILLLIIIFIGLIFSLISFALVLSTKSYKRLSLNGFNANTITLSNEIVAENIMIDYTEILKHNMAINDNKAKYFQRGYISLTFCIVLIPIFILVSYFI